MDWQKLKYPFVLCLLFGFLGKLSIRLTFWLRVDQLGGSERQGLQNFETFFDLLTLAGALIGLFLGGRWLWKKISDYRSHKETQRREQIVAVSRNALGERWLALVRFDAEIREAAEQLYPYGSFWVNELGRAFMALEEDRRYLPAIVDRLRQEAKFQSATAEEERWLDRFRTTADGQLCSEEALAILRNAEALGYALHVDEHTITATKSGASVSYLRSNADIIRFGKYLR